MRAMAAEGGSAVVARVLGTDVAYKLGAPGRHMVQNSLAVLGAVALLGGDLARAQLALASFGARQGQGRARHRSPSAPDDATLIDESYNANPASMRAAIALLGADRPVRPRPPHRRPGRHARARGDRAGSFMRRCAEPLEAAERRAGVPRRPADGARCGTPFPRISRGGYGESAAEIEEALAAAIAPGDVVMVKGSNASRMGPLVEALKRRLTAAGPATEEDAA